MGIGIVGTGPASEAVRAALADLGTDTGDGNGDNGNGEDFSVEDIDTDAIGEVAFAVVVGPTGTPVFERANRQALDTGTPWLAVELGGIGGWSGDEGDDSGSVEAAISGFAPETGCYDCLCARVAANRDDSDQAEERAEHAEHAGGDENTNSSGGDGGDRPIDAATARLAGAMAGHEVASALTGGESTILGGVIEIPHAEQRFLPVPGCECAEGRDRTLRREHDSRSLEEALARAERGFDERVGVVSQVGEIDSFPAPYYLARSCETTGFSDASAAREAAGVAAGWDEAFVKALGEALERYSAGVYRVEEFSTASVTDRDDAIAPETFVGRGDDIGDDAAETSADESSAAETSDEETGDEEPIPWVRGEHLATGERVSLPAEFVQFPPPERRFGSPITTGLGLGNSGTDALLSGLYEVIERDATMLAWYSTYEPLRLAIEDEAFATLARRARAEDLSVTPLLVTQDVDVPVISVAVHRDSWPRFALGSGAALDPTAAARGALAEALQNWMELRRLGHDAAMDAEGAIGRYSEFPDSARELVAPKTEIPAASVGPADPPTGIEELDAVIERVQESDLEPYAARLTPRDVELLGFEAVRVLVPRAQPLFTDEAVFGERARTVPENLGFEPRLDRAFHPYP